MIHHATSGFWDCYARLPIAIQQLADKNFELLKADPDHASLHFKKVGVYRSVRVGIAYRALGVEDGDTIVWFWIRIDLCHPTIKRFQEERSPTEVIGRTASLASGCVGGDPIRASRRT